jgi:hypothetical protein
VEVAERAVRALGDLGRVIAGQAGTTLAPDTASTEHVT